MEVSLEIGRLDLISLRKSMQEDLEETFRSALASYRAALSAVGAAGAQAYPSAGEEFKQALLNLQQQLSSEVSARQIAETEQRLEEELKSWGENASRYYQDRTSDVKELLLMVANAATQVGDRDQRYANQFNRLAERLQATVRLDDLATMRQNLGSQAAELMTTVTRMTQDGQDSIAHLRKELATYEARLEEVERIACVDQLTGVGNRRRVELQLEHRANKGIPFSVIYIDLNDFKGINDSLGHLAGDDLLKQFANELKLAFRATDVVGRWGGDEFLVIIDGGSREAEAGRIRISKWVNGEYTLSLGQGEHKVKVTAAVGVATWQPGDSISDVMHRADVAMYANKTQANTAEVAPAGKR